MIYLKRIIYTNTKTVKYITTNKTFNVLKKLIVHKKAKIISHNFMNNHNPNIHHLTQANNLKIIMDKQHVEVIHLVSDSKDNWPKYEKEKERRFLLN